MSRAILLLVVGALGLLAFGASAAAWLAASVDNSTPETAADEATPDAVEVAEAAADPAQATTTAVIDSNAIGEQRASDNCDAFLAAIARGEGTDRDDPYRICYGYRRTVGDLAWHPAEWHKDGSSQDVREWGGESLASLGPGYAGKVSTAAGRYQIILPTWLGCKRALALPDFSPESQDKAAVYLIRERGALDDVQAGAFDAAVARCARKPAIWASMPGANVVGQGMRRLDELRVAYIEAGGQIA